MSSGLMPALSAGLAGSTAPDHHRAFPVESGAPQPARNRQLLRGYADEGAAHPAVPHQLAEHEACGIGGDGKADALRAHDHRGVHADDFAMRGHQRAAGIARVERGVGLDHVVDQPAGTRAQRAAERRDDARGHRRLEAERIADGDHQLSAPQPLGVAKRRGGERHRLIDPQQGEIGIRVVADQARLETVGRRQSSP